MPQLHERLQQYGARNLSTEELLTVVLSTEQASDTTLEIFARLLAGYGSLTELLRADPGDLCYEHKLGPVRAAQLQAVLEIARRLAAPAEQKYRIKCVSDAANLVMAEMAHLDHEQMRVLALDTQNQVVVNQMLYQGTLNSSVLRVAEIFRPAIARKCARIILCHNHPSGQVQASPEDIEVTKQLVEAGKLLDIDVLDHIIIGDHRFLSLKEQMRW